MYLVTRYAQERSLSINKFMLAVVLYTLHSNRIFNFVVKETGSTEVDSEARKLV